MIDVADSSAVYYYHYDGLGSVVALSNSSGTSIQSYEYSVYGQVAASDPNFIANPYMFTGRRFDYETGLYYYRARYYNPYIGRFLQTDPVGYSAGMNLYAYCKNNPLAFVDPSGMITQAQYDDLYDFAEILRQDTLDGCMNDVEALALIADEVAWIVDPCDDPCNVREFVEVMMQLLSAYLWDPNWYNPFNTKANTDYVRFTDEGFKEEYREPLMSDGSLQPPGNRNQVTHFVGHMGAGFFGGGVAARYNLNRLEQGRGNECDIALGLEAIDVGVKLRSYQRGWDYWPPFPGYPRPVGHAGLKPSEVGDWIRDNLME